MSNHSYPHRRSTANPSEWPTFGLILACHGAWILAVFGIAAWSTAAAVVLLSLVLALYASLQHEVIHGHPFRDQRLNDALVFPALTLVIPYLRFRDTHLAHHRDTLLTDPYDDPESAYLDPGDWDRLSASLRAILSVNNTLAGRVLIGPVVGLVAFAACERRLFLGGDARVLRGWLRHIPAVLPVVALVWIAALPLWAYGIAVYAALSILKIRTFLEHQAHEKARGRTVIIEDRGLLAFLFLNNNLHVVHHSHPRVAWYRLPALYRQNAAQYLARNEGYRYRSYAEVFRRHFWVAKDPVAHPLWRR